ncbi:MAG TPA: oxidoreductase [Solirubrobacteraceae bacterium]|jgi:NAD(P)-dependent dehydrogenase (short-subunit alcohol dehydrogenase family)|nr:oxidoreductase [Solirubrobacteraceae bacterium]
MSTDWGVDQITDQSGRTAVVTGANSGLGLSAARELARHGARVVLACRDLDKGARAMQSLRAEFPRAELTLAALDLASLQSVQEFADRCLACEQDGGFDLLINNAGVMAPPRRVTADGFELQFGTNFLGHFALTARLVAAMEARTDARVVTVSSNAHKMGRINFDDLQSERRYSRWIAYAQSKLADLMFALELDRRLRAAGSTIKSVAAHPGYAATNLQTAAPPLLDRLTMQVTNLLVAQSAEQGALALLYAATAPDVEGGAYVGPDGIGEFRGRPRLVSPNARARDQQTATRLWEVAEQLTGVSFQIPSAAAA